MYSLQSLPNPRAVCCYYLRSAGESCPVPTKIHFSGHQNHVCSRSSSGRNQPSRSVFSGTLSNHHRLFFGHRILQRLENYQVWWCTHRQLVYPRICRFLRSSFWLKIRKQKNKKTNKTPTLNCLDLSAFCLLSWLLLWLIKLNSELT